MRQVREVLHAALAEEDPPHIKRRKRYTPVQRQGIRYERKVHEKLAPEYEWRYLQSPWIRYQSAGDGFHWCQPDALLFHPERGRITVLEIKLRHTDAAYRQMFDLYRPVVSHLFPAYKVGCCEVVRWFDPEIYTSVAPALCRVPEDVNIGTFGVHICRV